MNRVLSLPRPLSGYTGLAVAAAGAACFNLAYFPSGPSPLRLFIVGYLVCLVQLARLKTTRQSF